MPPAPRTEINFMPTSRREFIAGLGALALCPIERTEPDLILCNASVWTVNPRQPRAQAIAISKRAVLSIGTNEEVLRARRRKREEDRSRRQYGSPRLHRRSLSSRRSRTRPLADGGL